MSGDRGSFSVNDILANEAYDRRQDEAYDAMASRLSGELWRTELSSELRVKAQIPKDGKGRKDAKVKLFLAGGLAGGIAKTVGSPLSRATITMQTQAALGKPTQGLYTIILQTVKNEGLKGLCKGNGMDVLRSVPMTGLSFLTYGVVRKKLQDNTILTRKDHGVAQALVSGATAGEPKHSTFSKEIFSFDSFHPRLDCYHDDLPIGPPPSQDYRLAEKDLRSRHGQKNCCH